MAAVVFSISFIVFTVVMWYVTLLLIHFCTLSSGCNAYQACVDDVPPCQGQLCSDVSWWRAALAAITRAGGGARWREAVANGGCPLQLTSAQQVTCRALRQGRSVLGKKPPPPPPPPQTKVSTDFFKWVKNGCYFPCDWSNSRQL